MSCHCGGRWIEITKPDDKRKRFRCARCYRRRAGSKRELIDVPELKKQQLFVRFADDFFFVSDANGMLKYIGEMKGAQS